MNNRESEILSSTNFLGIAKNLLDFKNGLACEGDTSKDDPLIVRHFEPKFLTVYSKYCEAMKCIIPVSHHLMSICLDNLIPFCCWARDTNANILWIKSVLDENCDLRPEVRNGLSMILVYTVASAKAATCNDSDMFTVLQNPEYGLGIMNKTSLKIYNDPFFLFGFLKSCMSGLIDAGKIPENERQNQPKKSKRQSDNKEELMAFVQMKNILVDMLNKGGVDSVKSKVLEISTIWTERHKNIRNTWFTTALAILSVKQPVLSNLLGTGFLQSAYYRSFDPTTMLQYVSTSMRNDIGLSEHPQSKTVDTDTGGSFATSIVSSAALDINQASRQSDTSSPKIVPVVCSSYPTASPNERNNYYSEANLIMNAKKSPRSIQSAGPSSAVNLPMPAMRFKRVGVKEWEFNESRIYNVEALVHSHDTVFYLIDESKLSFDERLQKRITSQSTGFTSLQSELQQRGLLITSWHVIDHSHLLDYLEAWRSQGPTLSLCDFWAHISTSVAAIPSNPPLFRGGGVIGYEVAMQVGIMVRKNDALGITEDCWRLIYPRDLYRDTQNVSLGAFLSTFFPQLRSVFTRLAAGNSSNDLSSVVVKYFSHRIESEVSQAPKPEASCAYQTVGTLNDQCANILNRFDMNQVCFHDIILGFF